MIKIIFDRPDLEILRV